MDFDHIQGDKLYEVGDDLNGCSPDLDYVRSNLDGDSWSALSGATGGGFCQFYLQG